MIDLILMCLVTSFSIFCLVMIAANENDKIRKNKSFTKKKA